MRIKVDLQPIRGGWLTGIGDCRLEGQAAKEKRCPVRRTRVMREASFRRGGQER